MPRPQKCRHICALPMVKEFVPQQSDSKAETIVMTMDEYEVIRLIDLEGYTQLACAQQMGVARTTVTAMYEHARYQLADALVNGKPLQIAGGNIIICSGRKENRHCCQKKCCYGKRGEEK